MERIHFYFWKSRSKGQKGTMIGGAVLIIMLIAAMVFFTANTKFVPLYNNLSLQEAGQITAELDTRAVPYELENGGALFWFLRNRLIRYYWSLLLWVFQAAEV